MMTFLAQGTVLGLSAGFAPGPLLTLVVSETLRHGVRGGVRVALAPFVTDLPIIVLSLLVVSGLSRLQPVLGVISLLGALFVLYLGWENIRMKGPGPAGAAEAPRSLRKGIIVNALSPHPYLFWLTVGAPITWRALQDGPLSAAAFVGSFYALLVGSKIALAVAVGKSRSFLGGRAYLWTMRVLGVLLCLLAVMLLGDGIRLLSTS